MRSTICSYLVSRRRCAFEYRVVIG